VPYSDILNDPLFLTGCNSWVNYVDLMKDRHLSSLYIAMVSDPVGELVETGTLLTTGVAVGF